MWWSEWFLVLSALQIKWWNLGPVWQWILEHVAIILPQPWTMKSIVLSGKVVDMNDSYCCKSVTLSKFSDRFNAIWNFIIYEVPRNDTVKEITESFMTNPAQNKDEAFLFVSQRTKFSITPDIFAQTSLRYDEETSNTAQGGSKTSRNVFIEIRLISYTLTLDKIHKFLDELTEHYLEKIRKSREKTLFLYTLFKTDYESHIRDCWMENPFLSNRTFDNLFFEGKAKLLSHLDFFRNNQACYNRNGIPYTLGIGLSGPPGTGKTSLIKCIANHLGRHVISLSLKLIKTRMQLLEFFYESQYNSQNRPNSIGFDKKIIVLEDIDCLGSVVKRRSMGALPDASPAPAPDKKKLTELLQDKISKTQLDTLLADCRLASPDAITLDDILNLWDGLCETPHRILIITSNHYDELDPALVRPGRIDLTLHLRQVTMNVLKEMFSHLFAKPWPKGLSVSANILKTHTPAKIINLFMESGRNEGAFLKALCK